MALAPRTVALGYHWDRLTAPVDVRFTTAGRKRFEAAAAEGLHIPHCERHTYLTYSFSEVRQAVDAEPGIYHVEGFHTEGHEMPDPASMSKEHWSEVVDQ